MSSISVLQAPGPGQVASVKPVNNVSSPAPSTTTPGQAFAADPAPSYDSPRLEIDPLLNQVILDYRDGQSGIAEYQVPSKSQLLLYQGTQNQASAAAKPNESGFSSV
jgi:hypothetical protein